MSFDKSNLNNQELVSELGNDQETTTFSSPTALNEMLQNRELLTCYKCKETFTIQDNDQQEHQLDSNNILLGIILNQKTPSSICLKCLSMRMMDVIVEQFTKNSKDYEGMFFRYDQKFKV